MRIALVNIEPKIENTAYMQISRYHKDVGDSVEWYSPLFHREYDKIYCSSLFQFTSKKTVTSNMICGGTGFGIEKKLPPEIEACDLDYSIYPNCKTSYLWFSRGCLPQRKIECPFCIVLRKEGTIHPVKPKSLNPNGKTITVVDNNPFANPKWQDMIQFLIEHKTSVNFCSGIDIRIFNDLQGLMLQKLRLHKQLNIAWDNPHLDLRPKIEHLLRYIPAYKIQCYVLVEFWSTKEQDLERIYWLRDQGIDPYVMPYRKTRYAKDLARWCNTRKAIGACPNFENYNRKEFERMNHSCYSLSQSRVVKRL